MGPSPPATDSLKTTSRYLHISTDKIHKTKTPLELLTEFDTSRL